MIAFMWQHSFTFWATATIVAVGLFVLFIGLVWATEDGPVGWRVAVLGLAMMAAGTLWMWVF